MQSCCFYFFLYWLLDAKRSQSSRLCMMDSVSANSSISMAAAVSVLSCKSNSVMSHKTASVLFPRRIFLLLLKIYGFSRSQRSRGNVKICCCGPSPGFVDRNKRNGVGLHRAMLQDGMRLLWCEVACTCSHGYLVTFSFCLNKNVIKMKGRDFIWRNLTANKMVTI